MNTEKRVGEIHDANDRQRKANYFWQIEHGKTAEYKKILKDLDDTFTRPEQRSRAMTLLRSGRAMSADEAAKLMREEDFEDRNTHL